MDLLFELWKIVPAVATMVADSMPVAKRKVLHLSCRTAAAIMCTTVTELNLTKHNSALQQQDLECELAERLPFLKSVSFALGQNMQAGGISFHSFLTKLSQHSPVALSRLTSLDWAIQLGQMGITEHDGLANLLITNIDLLASFFNLLEKCSSLRQLDLIFVGVVHFHLQTAPPERPLQAVHSLFAPPVSVGSILSSDTARKALTAARVYQPWTLAGVLPSSLAAIGQLQHLDLRSNRDVAEQPCAMLSAVTQLTRLRLSMDRLSVQDQEKALLTLQQHPRLSRLEVFNMDGLHATPLAALTQVTWLALGMMPLEADLDGTTASLLTLPSVKHLYLDFRGMDTSPFRRQVMSTMATPKLEQVQIDMYSGVLPITELASLCVRYPAARIGTEASELDGVYRRVQAVGADGAGLVEAARKAPHVLESEIFWDNTVGGMAEADLVEAIQIAGGGLGRLHLILDGHDRRHVIRVTDVILQCVATECSGLKHLSMYPREGFTPQGVSALTALRSLEHLAVSGCKGLDDDCIVGIARHLTKLTYLAIDGLQGVSEAALLHLCDVSQGHKENVLHLRQAAKLTVEGRQELVVSGWRCDKLFEI